MEWETDADLITAARSGDAGAFERLMRRHYAGCLRYAYRMLGERADAEDAVQDTFVRAYRALSRYRERNRFRPWLLRILRNRCRSLSSRQRRRLEGLRSYAAQTGGAPAPALVDGDDIKAALASLPPLLREAFLLKHVEDLSYAEMARVTDASVSALKMRVNRACSALRDSLARRPGEA